MPVEQGNKVKVHYTGTFDDGTVFDSSEGKDPLEFVAGAGMVIKGFDDAIVGMEKDEEKEIHLEAQEAYGDYSAELVRKIPRDQLPKDQEPQPGMMVGLTTPDGVQFAATIKEVTDTEVTLDANHPLAGKALNFKLKVVEYGPDDSASVEGDAPAAEAAPEAKEEAPAEEKKEDTPEEEKKE